MAKIKISFNVTVEVKVNIVVVYDVVFVQVLLILTLMLLNGEVLIFNFVANKHRVKFAYSALQKFYMMLQYSKSALLRFKFLKRILYRLKIHCCFYKK